MRQPNNIFEALTEGVALGCGLLLALPIGFLILVAIVTLAQTFLS